MLILDNAKYTESGKSIYYYQKRKKGRLWFRMKVDDQKPLSQHSQTVLSSGKGLCGTRHGIGAIAKEIAAASDWDSWLRANPGVGTVYTGFFFLDDHDHQKMRTTPKLVDSTNCELISSKIEADRKWFHGVRTSKKVYWKFQAKDQISNWSIFQRNGCLGCVEALENSSLFREKPWRCWCAPVLIKIAGDIRRSTMRNSAFHGRQSQDVGTSRSGIIQIGHPGGVRLGSSRQDSVRPGYCRSDGNCSFPACGKGNSA